MRHVIGLTDLSGLLTAPFYAAALLQGIYLILYRRVFGAYDAPAQRSEQAQAVPAPGSRGATLD